MVFAIFATKDAGLIVSKKVNLVKHIIHIQSIFCLA